jgi:hypothetical protein
VAAIARLKLRNDSPEKNERKMTDWAFVLVPLLVLPIILLFRFVGCGLNTKGELEPEIPLPKKAIPPEVSPFEPVPTKAPSYRDTIVAEPGVIAYWRLVDDPSDIPAGGGAPEAKDEKNFQNGKYITVPGGLPQVEPGAEAGSKPADGDFDPYQTSLIANEPASTKCRSFNGGYMLVEFKPGLYTDEFTLEAWIKPLWTQTKDYDHVLVGAGGGFWIFANGEDGEDRWRVYLAQSDSVVDIQPAPIVAHNATTHLAVTVKTGTETSKKKVTIFANGKIFGPSLAEYDYSPPDGVPLFIGVKNIEPDPANPPVPRHPVLSSLQEVVLYEKVLSVADIKKHYDIGIGKGGA